VIDGVDDWSSKEIPDQDVNGEAEESRDWDQVRREVNGEGASPTATLAAAEDEVSQG